jgi:hypothetical protein
VPGGSFKRRLLVMTMRRLGLMLIGVLLVGGGALARPGEGGSRESLRGLKGVFVSVHQNPGRQPDHGLTNSELWSEIVVRLQNAGLKVLNEEEWEKTRGKPYLYLNLTDTVLAGKGQTGAGYLYTCSLDLMQEVALTRGAGDIVDACTWSRGVTIVVPSNNLRQLRMVVDKLAAEFTDAVEAARRTAPEAASRVAPLEKR